MIAYPSPEQRIQYKKDLFEEIANDLQIQLEVIDEPATTLVFTYGKVRRLVYGYSFGVNGSGETRVCVDKGATSKILERERIAHVPHVEFSRGQAKEDSWPAIRAFGNGQPDPFNVVCKPPKGQAGIDVLHASDEKGLEAVTDSLFQKMPKIVLSPFYRIEDEYRVIVLNNNVEYVLRKERRSVVGDGVSKMEQLIRGSRHHLDKKSGIPQTAEFLNQIPALNQKVYITWKHNGFTAHRISTESQDPLQLKIRAIASRTTKALAIVFCCVDVIKVEGNEEPLVLEVNTDVWIEPHEVGFQDAKKTYTKVISQLVGKKERCCASVQRISLAILGQCCKRLGSFLQRTQSHEE